MFVIEFGGEGTKKGGIPNDWSMEYLTDVKSLPDGSAPFLLSGEDRYSDKT